MADDRDYSFVVVPRDVESAEDTTIWLQVIDGRNLDPEAIADIRRDRPKLHRDLREMFPGCEATVISIGYEPGG